MCFQWHCLGCHPWISTGGKQIATDWSTRKRRKLDISFSSQPTQVKRTSSTFPNTRNKFLKWAEPQWSDYSMSSFILLPPEKPALSTGDSNRSHWGEHPRICKRVAGCSILTSCNFQCSTWLVRGFDFAVRPSVSDIYTHFQGPNGVKKDGGEADNWASTEFQLLSVFCRVL